MWFTSSLQIGSLSLNLPRRKKPKVVVMMKMTMGVPMVAVRFVLAVTVIVMIVFT